MGTNQIEEPESDSIVIVNSVSAEEPASPTSAESSDSSYGELLEHQVRKMGITTSLVLLGSHVAFKYPTDRSRDISDLLD